MTTAPRESGAVLKIAEEITGRKPIIRPLGKRTYHDLGNINGSRVFLARCQQGSGGLGGSQEAARIAIETLRPGAVIMVGFAFGVDEATQQIGDVLIAERLCLYDDQRVGSDADGNVQIHIRGDRPPASPRLLDWFGAALLEWNEPSVRIRTALMLSGEKLVDNITFRNQLLKQEPEALGGEMEGAGLYVACQNEKVDWALVKAICDWGNEKNTNKAERQRIAAHNAASFVMHTLALAPLTPPERKEPDFTVHTQSAEPLEDSPLEQEEYHEIREGNERPDSTQQTVSYSRTYVEASGVEGYGPVASAIPNDVVNVMVFIENRGEEVGKNPTIRVNLDPRMEYVENSSYGYVKEDNKNKWHELSDTVMNITRENVVWGFIDMPPSADKALYVSFKVRIADGKFFTPGDSLLPISADAGFENSPVHSSRANIAVTYDPAHKARVLFRADFSKNSPDLLRRKKRLIVAPDEEFAIILSLQNMSGRVLENVNVQARLPRGFSFVGSCQILDAHGKQVPYNGENPTSTEGITLTAFESGTPHAVFIRFAAKAEKEAFARLSRAKNFDVNSSVQLNKKILGKSTITLSVDPANGVCLVLQIEDPFERKWTNDLGHVAPGQELNCRLMIQGTFVGNLERPVLQVNLPDCIEYITDSLKQDRTESIERLQKSFFQQGITVTDVDSSLYQEFTFKVRTKGASSNRDRHTVIAASLSEGGNEVAHEVAKMIIKAVPVK